MKDLGFGFGPIALGIVLIPELKLGDAPPELVIWLPIILIALGGIIEIIMAFIRYTGNDR